MDFKLYSVRAGKHNFTPDDHPFFTFDYSCYYKFLLTPSMWYNASSEDYPYRNPNGTSYRGWNKLGMGFTSPWNGNANQSGMLGWFPIDNMENWFTIVAYINHKGGGWEARQIMQCAADTVYEGQTIWEKRQIRFLLREDVKGDTQPHPWTERRMDLKRPWGARGIGAYFGGQYPAMKDMEFHAIINY